MWACCRGSERPLLAALVEEQLLAALAARTWQGCLSWSSAASRPGVLTLRLLSSGGTALCGGGCPSWCRVLGRAAIPGSDCPECLWVLVTISWGQVKDDHYGPWFPQVTGNQARGLVGKPEAAGDSETDPECGLTAAK